MRDRASCLHRGRTQNVRAAEADLARSKKRSRTTEPTVLWRRPCSQRLVATQLSVIKMLLLVVLPSPVSGVQSSKACTHGSWCSLHHPGHPAHPLRLARCSGLTSAASMCLKMVSQSNFDKVLEKNLCVTLAGQDVQVEASGGTVRLLQVEACEWAG